MVKFIAIYGMVMFVTSIAGAIIASMKRRDWNYWMTMTFFFPPAIIILILKPKNTGALTKRRTLDDEDRDLDAH